MENSSVHVSELPQIKPKKKQKMNKSDLKKLIDSSRELQ